MEIPSLRPFPFKTVANQYSLLSIWAMAAESLDTNFRFVVFMQTATTLTMWTPPCLDRDVENKEHHEEESI